MNAQGKEITDKNGVQRFEVDKLVTKIRVGHGNIALKSPPAHTLAGNKLNQVSKIFHSIIAKYKVRYDIIFVFLADAAATFFNSNPRLVLDIASPIIEDTAATVSKALVARALSVLTKQELLP